MRITGLDHSKLVTVQHTADSADNSPFRSHIVNIEGHSRPTDSADIVATAATIVALTKDLRSLERRAARLTAEPKVRQVHRVEAHPEQQLPNRPATNPNVLAYVSPALTVSALFSLGA